MIESLRRFIRGAVVGLAQTVGTRLVDCKTDRSLGKALIIPWRGKIHVIGLDKSVRPAFLPQKRVTYWKQELGFTIHDPPDFEHLRPSPPNSPDQNKSTI
jgi:hypothetical protein